MLGQDVGTLKNAMLLGGSHIIDIKETIGIDLVDGQYIYKLMEVLVALANKF